MKGYFLFAPVEQENAGPGSGVERKVRSQHKALNEYVQCELVILQPTTYSGSPAEKITRRLPFTAAWRNWKYRGEFDDADFLYIRQVYHDASFVRYLQQIRKRNPRVKIIYEVPTYPYDNEKGWSLSRIPFEAKERINRLKAAKYMDRVVTFYGQEEIWGVPCICLMNGYDFSAVQLPHRETDDAIHLAAVSLTAPWHGYDRLITGMHDYYQCGGTENIVFHMVGNILPEHQKMVEQFGLQEHVVFYGRLPADKLRPIYEKAAIGVDILAGHRRGSAISSTLKSREYGAYGLPILTACPVDYLPEDYPYQILVPDGEDAIDIQQVLNRYHRIYDGKGRNAVAKEIRAFAEERCDMRITMKPVADWLINNSKSGTRTGAVSEMGRIKRKLKYYYSFKIKKMDGSDVAIMNMRNRGIKVGDNCRMFTEITAREATLIAIGDRVTISSEVEFCTHDNAIIKAVPGKTDLVGRITIGDDCFIGMRSIIMYGVTLGDHCIVGAGSVVTKSFPPRTVLAGNPAKAICTIDEYAEKYQDYAMNFKEIPLPQRAEYFENHPELMVTK